MNSKPLRNSKGVSKPFRSPFGNVNTPTSDSNKSNPNTPKSDACKTPLSVTSKRLLFEQTPPAKRPRKSEERREEVTSTGEEERLFSSDLDALRRTIKEKKESIDCIRARLLYREKNKAEDLEVAIGKWTEVCQNVLRDYQSDMQERNGHPMNMIEILSHFKIDPSLVHFSAEDDTFY